MSVRGRRQTRAFTQPCWVIAALLLSCASALEFEMQAQTKCIFEEMNANVIAVGDFKAFQKDHPEHDVYCDIKVEDPAGRVLHENHGQHSGQFAFTSKVAGEYKVCFTVHDIQTAFNTKLRLDWKTGVAASDWDSIAKKEHLDALTLEMRKLESAVREIYTDMLQLQKKEEAMRDLNEVTNGRVAWYSVLALLVCVGAAGFQLWYLKRFFTRKKLL